jgi:hypothetical protein
MLNAGGAATLRRVFAQPAPVALRLVPISSGSGFRHARHTRQGPTCVRLFTATSNPVRSNPSSELSDDSHPMSPSV